MPGDLHEFLSNCSFQPDRFGATSAGAAWRAGGVVFARADSRFLAVRKSLKEGYDFAGLWALPGGMVRSQSDDESFLSTSRRALSDRFVAETGVQPGPITPARILGPVTTAYWVRGIRRYTVMTVFVSEPNVAQEPRPNDRSVSEAAWVEILPDLSTVAPGNRLILAHLLWSELDETQRAEVWPLVSAAHAECVQAASEAGVASPSAPWDLSATKDAWIGNWPTA